MDDIKIEPTDIYSIINETYLNDTDRSVITILYQPLIGSHAISLYYSLWSDLNQGNIMSDELSLKHLSQNTQLSYKELDEARTLLEAVGLLKTYIKKSDYNNYVFSLLSPLSPKEFFDNVLLNSKLYFDLGEQNYQKAKAIFALPKINLQKYKEITSSFDDIFKIIHHYENNNFLLKDKKIKTPSLKNEFDFTLIEEALPTKKILNDENRELIKNLSYVYNISPLELKTIVIDSINLGKLNEAELRKTCKNHYKFKSNNKNPEIIRKQMKQDTELNENSKRAQMIHIFEHTTPYEFLKAKYKGAVPTERDLNLIEELIIDQKLDPSVVNVLIDFALKVNNNKLTKKYVEAIASQWKISNISNAKEAMEFAEKNYKKKKTTSPRKTVSKTPEWFDKNLEKETISEEEKTEMEDLLKEFS